MARDSNHPVKVFVDSMPWMQVEARVVDTSAHRARADAHVKTSLSTPGEKAQGAGGARVEMSTTPERPNRGEAPQAKASPCTAQTPFKKERHSLCSAPIAHAQEEQGEGGDDEARKERRTRIMFQDLLRESYPRHGVSLKEEFGDSFKAARIESTFSAFPEPGVCAVGFR